MNEMLNAALAYADRGWYIFPIDPNSDKGKSPYRGTHGVKDATTKPKIIRGWWKKHPEAMIGLDVGRSGFMVYDMDPGSSIKELNEALDGQLPKTELESKTPRGGKHLFYSLGKDDVVPSSASKIATNVDVRSSNGYVLLPPSHTESGEYNWINEKEATYRTDEMVRTAHTGKEASKDHDTWIIEQDIPENIGLAVAWLRDKAKLAIQGEGGDQCTYDTGCMMKSYGLSQAKALEVMLEYWNGDCKPPWDYDELEVKVSHSYQYNTSQPGNMTPAFKTAKAKELFKPVYNVEKSEWTDNGYRWTERTGRDRITPPVWLVDNFIPENSYVMMYGAYGTFKSFIALDIAKSVSTGGMSPVNLWGAVRQGNVLFAVSEGRSQFTKRENVWEKEKMFSQKCEGLVLSDPVPKVTEEKLERYIQGCLARSPEGYKLMVIDTVGRAMQGANESATEDAGTFSALVEVLQKRLGCAVLALHHQGKANTGPRGSSVFGADADVLIHLERAKNNEYTVAMEMEKQKDGEVWSEPKHLRLHEIHLSKTQKSLAAMPHTPLKEKDEQKQAKANLYLINLTDEIVYETLKADPTSRDAKTLAEVVSVDDRMRGKAKHRAIIGYLEVIRETESGYKSTKFFDPLASKTTGKWAWKL